MILGTHRKKYTTKDFRHRRTICSFKSPTTLDSDVRKVTKTVHNTIFYSRIVNHTELCECSLTVAYEYQINKAMLQCTSDQQPASNFVTYFAHNQAILDVLKSPHDIDISNQLGMQLGTLTEDIPQFNLPELKWYRINEDDVPHVYSNTSDVVDVELTEFLYDVAQGIDNYMYTNVAEWTVAQKGFGHT